MAKLKIELSIPDWTVDQLRQAVRAIDALDDAIPIAFEHITAVDVIMYIFSNQLGAPYDIIASEMRDHYKRGHK